MFKLTHSSAGAPPQRLKVPEYKKSSPVVSAVNVGFIYNTPS